MIQALQHTIVHLYQPAGKNIVIDQSPDFVCFAAYMYQLWRLKISGLTSDGNLVSMFYPYGPNRLLRRTEIIPKEQVCDRCTCKTLLHVP